MSGFKRMQSRVFWGEMAAQDIGDRSPLIGSMSAASSIASLPNAYSNQGMVPSEESETSLREDSDASDGNVTAIRVIGEVDVERDRIDASPERSKRPREKLEDPAGKKSGNGETAYDRSGNAIPLLGELAASIVPASPCDRSLDSGFSDSDLSNSHDIRENVHADVSRRRERRKRRDLVARIGPQLSRRVHDRVSCLWRECERPPDPAHTSTPKAERHPKYMRANRRRSRYEDTRTVRQYENERIVEEQRYEEDHESTRAVPASLEDECLGDFLYASEPPADEDASATISSVSPIAGASALCVERNSIASARPAFGKFVDLLDRETAVKAWLADLVTETEDECASQLQSKTLPRRRSTETRSDEIQTRDLRLLTSSATAAATELLVRADGFTRHLEQVVEKLYDPENGRSERELLRTLEDEAFAILSELGGPPPRRIQQGNARGVLAQLEALKNFVDEALDARLDFYIERVVRGLEEAPREGGSVARGALAALTALGLAGNRAGNSIARCSGIRVLLTSLVSSARLSSDLRASTLRALASVCCCARAIEQFAKEDGPEILLDVLSNDARPETERTEAAALVVQITAAWTNALGLPHLVPHARELVRSLTRLAERTRCSQTLLLAAAGLNNLAESRHFVLPIVEQDAIRELLRCVKRSSAGNVWLMEQVAALIGKLARIPEARKYLAEARASVALVSFLRMVTPGLEDAYERLKNTASQALTRLCVDPVIARQVVALGGADCLAAYESAIRDDRYRRDHDDRTATANFRYTKSLRRACKRAAHEIDVAKACDY